MFVQYSENGMKEYPVGRFARVSGRYGCIPCQNGRMLKVHQIDFISLGDGRVAIEHPSPDCQP